MSLKSLGAASAAILKTLLMPMVGKEDLADAVGYVENAGAPTSVVPDFIGQKLFDTTNNAWYRAHGVSAGNWAQQGPSSSLGIGAFRETGRNLRTQAAPAAKTTSTTLTAAEIMAGLITANQGAAGAATYTMPLGTDIETALIAAFPGLSNDDSFDFTIVNISTVAAEDVTVAGNTGTTAVGNMTIASNAAVTDQAWGTFRVRRTAANTYSFYRIG